MKLIGQSTITTFEESANLRFVATRGRGWIQLVVPAILIVLAGAALVLKQYLLALFPLLPALYLLAYFAQPAIVQLDVSQSEMMASKDIESPSAQKDKVMVSEIKSLGYEFGNKNQPRGLYAKQGRFKRTCLLPGLSSQQANEIADVICKKFPNIPR